MACPNFKNGPKNSLGPLGVNLKKHSFIITNIMQCSIEVTNIRFSDYTLGLSFPKFLFYILILVYYKCNIK
jgi:hypothetical protein